MGLQVLFPKLPFLQAPPLYPERGPSASLSLDMHPLVEQQLLGPAPHLPNQVPQGPGSSSCDKPCWGTMDQHSGKPKCHPLKSTVLAGFPPTDCTSHPRPTSSYLYPSLYVPLACHPPLQ